MYVWNAGKKRTFPESFRKATREKTGKVRLPKFKLEEIEDYFTYYVLILGIPESTFWETDLNFLSRVAENKSAYDGWLNYEKEKARRQAHGRKK